MARNLAKLALEQFQILNWILFSDEPDVVPELTNLFVKETNVTLGFRSLQGTENKIVGLNRFRLETERWVANKTFSLEKYLKSYWFVQGIA